MEPTRDFEELFASFAAEDVRFVVIGAYALAFHELPRYTKDVDLLIEASEDNAARILRALSAFGFGALSLRVEDLSAPGTTIQLGHEPNRVDLCTEIDGVSFEEVWRDREHGRYGNTPVSFVSREHLIRNKRASGRKQDLADLEKLEST